MYRRVGVVSFKIFIDQEKEYYAFKLGNCFSLLSRYFKYLGSFNKYETVILINDVALLLIN